MGDIIEEESLDFLEEYKGKLWKVYSENREELENIAAGLVQFNTQVEREAFFSELTKNIFPPKTGLGMSYDMVVFFNSYNTILQQIDMIAYTKNLTRGSLWFYDKEHGNLVSMMDTSTETSLMYNYPGSIVTVSQEKIREAAEKGTEMVFLNGEECHALSPVLNKDGEAVCRRKFPG